MKKNLITWIFAGLGALALVMSVIVMIPGIARAATITVTCQHGPSVSCSGPQCTGTDNVGCQCENGTTGVCARQGDPLPEETPVS